MWELLKKRWGVTTDLQVLHILLIFAITGFSTLYVHNHIDYLLGIEEDGGFLVKALVFVFIILPVFNIILFFWGTVLGQRKFVTAFIRLKLDLLFKWKFLNRTR